MRVEEVAQELGISKSHAYKVIHIPGTLPAMRGNWLNMLGKGSEISAFP